MADVNRSETTLLSRPLFERTAKSGRVDATRTGNAFEIRTRGVRQFTLLLSPDAIDFGRPVVVVVNGRRVHDSVVKPAAATLFKWAARDRDRTMLYGSELSIAVP